MPGAPYDIVAARNEYLAIGFQYCEEDGETPIPLTGYTAKMEVRASAGATVVLTLSSEGVSPYLVITEVTGEVTIGVSATILEPIVAGTYLYDLVIFDPTDKPTVLAKGKFILDAGITDVVPAP